MDFSFISSASEKWKLIWIKFIFSHWIMKTKKLEKLCESCNFINDLYQLQFKKQATILLRLQYFRKRNANNNYYCWRTIWKLVNNGIFDWMRNTFEKREFHEHRDNNILFYFFRIFFCNLMWDKSKQHNRTIVKWTLIYQWVYGCV